MSTLTHERTDLFIGGAWQPSSDQELTRSSAQPPRNRSAPPRLAPSPTPTVRSTRPGMPCGQHLGPTRLERNAPSGCGRWPTSRPPEATTRPDWSAMRTACRSASPAWLRGRDRQRRCATTRVSPKPCPRRSGAPPTSRAGSPSSDASLGSRRPRGALEFPPVAHHVQAGAGSGCTVVIKPARDAFAFASAAEACGFRQR